MLTKVKQAVRIFFPKKTTAIEKFELILRKAANNNTFLKENNFYKFNSGKDVIVLRGHQHSDLAVFNQIFKNKEYEIMPSLIQFNIHHSPIIIDAGANVGYTSVYLSNRLAGCKIFAIEPSSQNCEVLKKNIEVNNVNAKIYENALAELKGKRFSIGKNFRNAKDWALTTEENQEGELIGITLDEIIQNNNLTYITLLKIDIEGAERFLFADASYLAFLEITKIIAIEIHDEFNIRERIYNVLKDYGFLIFNMGELTIGVRGLNFDDKI